MIMRVAKSAITAVLDYSVNVVCAGDTMNVDIKEVKEPTVTSTNVTMEMIVGSVEVDDDGNRKVNRFVSFTTGNGHHIIYPWEALKQTVKQWMEIEGTLEENR